MSSKKLPSLTGDIRNENYKKSRTDKDNYLIKKRSICKEYQQFNDIYVTNKSHFKVSKFY